MASPDLSVFGRIKTKQDFDREAEEFALRKATANRVSASNSPAALQLADAYLQARNTGDHERANAIQEFAKTMQKNITYDPATGKYVPISGAPEAIGEMEYQKNLGGETAKQQVKSTYEPARAEETQRRTSQVDLEYKPKIAGANIQAEASGKAAVDLPQFMESSRTTLGAIKDLRESPGLSAIVGAPNPFKGKLPLLPAMPASPAADAQAKLDFVNSKDFKIAFESLKGGGPISDREGEAATKAVANLNSAQSEAEFNKALDELETHIQNMIAIKQKIAQGVDADPLQENTVNVDDLINKYAD